MAAYERFDIWNREADKYVLEAHRMPISSLIDEAGMYRRGVSAGRQVIQTGRDPGGA